MATLLDVTQNWLAQRKRTNGGTIPSADQNSASAINFISNDLNNPLIPVLSEADLTTAERALTQIRAMLDGLSGQVRPLTWAAQPINPDTFATRTNETEGLQKRALEEARGVWIEFENQRDAQLAAHSQRGPNVAKAVLETELAQARNDLDLIKARFGR